MDLRVYKAIYHVSTHHHWVGTLFSDIETASIPFMVVITVALWLFARPGGDRKWKLAAGSGLGAAAVALLVNRIISSIWFRERPPVDHHFHDPWSSKTDASFPSDHASASFAIATAVFLYDKVVGGLFFLAAAVIGAGRLFIGAHYPSDVGAGILVGLASGILVVRVAKPAIRWLVRLVERLTDPVLRPLWRKAA